ncbi:MAG: hypothetical protein Q9227_003849 [Pyrenula ochraceoflavens]
MPCSHCNLPIYDNKPSGACQQCTLDVKLRLNPAIVPGIVDETGSLGDILPPGAIGPHSSSSSSSQSSKSKTSKLQWTDDAWSGLLGRTPEVMGQLATRAEESDWKGEEWELLGCLVERLMWLRVVLRVAWIVDDDGGRDDGVGRLWVVKVEG